MPPSPLLSTLYPLPIPWLVTMALALPRCSSRAHQSRHRARELSSQGSAHLSCPAQSQGAEESEDLNLDPYSATVQPQASHFPSLGQVSKMVEHFPAGSVSGVFMLADNIASSEKALWCHQKSSDSGPGEKFQILPLIHPLSTYYVPRTVQKGWKY